MISKNKLKELTAYRQQKRCDDEAVFVVEGVKMAAEAMAAGAHLRSVCATEGWLSDNKPIADEVMAVSAAELERLSLMRAPNEVWMLVERESPRLPEGARSVDIVLALDHIQDPGNMGTMMRTADWFGIRRIVCSADTVSCYNPKVVQATMGAIFRTKVEYVDLPEWLDECGMPIYGASLAGQRLVAKPEGKAVLLIGNESRGISPEAMRRVTHPVLIPNVGATGESLNAAVAAAIFMDRMVQ